MRMREILNKTIWYNLKYNKNIIKYNPITFPLFQEIIPCFPISKHKHPELWRQQVLSLNLSAPVYLYE